MADAGEREINLARQACTILALDLGWRSDFRPLYGHAPLRQQFLWDYVRESMGGEAMDAHLDDLHARDKSDEYRLDDLMQPNFHPDGCACIRCVLVHEVRAARAELAVLRDCALIVRGFAVGAVDVERDLAGDSTGKLVAWKGGNPYPKMLVEIPGDYRLTPDQRKVIGEALNA